MATKSGYVRIQRAIDVHAAGLQELAKTSGGPIAVSVFAGSVGAPPEHRTTWRGFDGEPDAMSGVFHAADDRAKRNFNGLGIGVGIAGASDSAKAAELEQKVLESIAGTLGETMAH